MLHCYTEAQVAEVLTAAGNGQVVFKDSDLRNAKFNGAMLVKAQLQGSILNDVDLSNANLSEAALWNVSMQYAQLNDANLYSANLEGSDLEGASLARASLRHANLKLVNLKNAHMRSADLRNANLCDADLECVNFTNADLRDADLRNANLRNCKLTGANLHGVKLEGANLILGGQDQLGNLFYAFETSGVVNVTTGRFVLVGMTAARSLHHFDKYVNEALYEDRASIFDRIERMTKQRGWKLEPRA